MSRRKVVSRPELPAANQVVDQQNQEKEEASLILSRSAREAEPCGGKMAEVIIYFKTIKYDLTRKN